MYSCYDNDMTLSILLAWLCVSLGVAIAMATSYSDALWRHRKYATEAAFAVMIVGALFIVGDTQWGLTGIALYILVSAAVCFLALRIYYGRLPEDHLRRSSSRSATLLLLCAVAVLPLSYASITVQPETIGIILLAVALAAAGLFAAQTAWGLYHYTERYKKPVGAGARPPTVTLAIPARNETHALARCLDAALLSTYPRLEIIVLDDCSQDTTSQLIRSFAHSGVRFIQGDAPTEGWLGKNSAYATLLKEATGEYIFFMGADTQLEPQTITHLVAYAERKMLDMVSVLPQQHRDYVLPLLMQNLRYVWQIVLPLPGRHQPVSPESWLVKRTALLHAGGFETVAQEILPEKALAEHFAAKDRYRFIIADANVSAYYGKKWSSQIETATRLWYPVLARQPFVAVLVSACLLVFGLGPFIALFASNPYIFLLACLTCTLYLLIYAAIMYRLQPQSWWLSVWLLPFVLVQEATLVLVSMMKYEFTTVNWKGRNICYPVLLRQRS